MGKRVEGREKAVGGQPCPASTNSPILQMMRMSLLSRIHTRGENTVRTANPVTLREFQFLLFLEFFLGDRKEEPFEVT